MHFVSSSYLSSTFSKVNRWIDTEFSDALKKRKLVDCSVGKIALLFVVLAAAAGLYSVSLGVDQNWDLRNYHFYNPYAALEGRYRYDIAPAQVQSYLNPLLDFPFFLMIRFFNDWPRSIAFAQGAVHGVNLLFVFLLAWHLIGSIERISPGLRLLLAALALLIGATGAGSAPLVGATMGDVPVAAPMLAALTLVVCGVDRAETDAKVAMRNIAIAGLLAGVSVGAKLTMGAYGLALALSLVLLPRALLVGGFLRFAAASMAGVLASGGFHFFRMWRIFEDPIFPLFNNIFHSPFLGPMKLYPMRFLPKTLGDYLFYPFEWALKFEHGIVSELAFRDIRIALVITLGALVVAKWALTRRRQPKGISLSAGTRAFMLFTLVGYVVWLLMFSTYRFLVTIELLSGILVVLALGFLVPRSAWLTASVVAAVACILTTVPLDWGHAQFGKRYIEFQAPKIAADSLVVIVGGGPVSYVIPFFDPRIRWVSVDNNFLHPDQRNLLMERARRLIREHRGSLLVLQAGATQKNSDAILARFSLARGPCETISSNLTPEHYELCAVVRIGA